MMSRRFTPKVVTANALIEGDAVYLAADGSWVRNHHEAEFLRDEAQARVRLLEAEARVYEVVDVYLADAIAGPDGPEPAHLREVSRTRRRSGGIPGGHARRSPAPASMSRREPCSPG